MQRQKKRVRIDPKDPYKAIYDQTLFYTVQALDLILRPKKTEKHKALVEKIARRAALMNGLWAMKEEKARPATFDQDRAIDRPVIQIFESIGLNPNDYGDWRLLLLALAWLQQKGRPKELTSEQYFAVGYAFAQAAEAAKGLGEQMSPEVFAKTKTMNGKKIDPSTLRRNLRKMLSLDDDFFKSTVEFIWIYEKRKLIARKMPSSEIVKAKEKFYEEFVAEQKKTRAEDWKMLLGKK